MRRETLALLCLAAGSTALAVRQRHARGHANLTDPTPRNLEANKTGPCGIARTMSPTTFTAGETITVRWVETIEHPGWYRIAFSPSADLGFDENVILDDIPDTQGGTMPHMYEATIALPDTPCTDCTLQVIQYMTETTPPTLYFSCADLVLEAPAPLDGGPDADPAAPDAAPPGAPDATPANDDVGDPPGLCSATPDRSSAWSALLILAALLFIRLR